MLSASRICKLMEATNPQTAQDAEYLWKRSEPAQKEGVAGAAACAHRVQDLRDGDVEGV